jgi:ABC-type lipoprotein release transport system permease subunit
MPLPFGNPLTAAVRLLCPSASTVLLGFRYITTRWIAWLSVLGFAVGILVLIVVTSVMNGFVKEIRTSIRSSLSDLIIRYQPLRKGDGPPSLAAVRAALAEIPEIDAQAVSPRITWFALIAGVGINQRKLAPDGTFEWTRVAGAEADAFLRRDEALFCQVIGIDFDTDRLATNVGDSLRGFEQRETKHVADLPVPDADDPFHVRREADPALLPAELLRRGEDGERNAIPGVLGAFLAKKLRGTALQAGLGDPFHRGCEVTLLTSSPERLRAGVDGGALVQSYRSVVMTGTFRTGTYDLDKDIVFLDRRDMARNLLEIGAGADEYFTEIVVKTKGVDEERNEEIARLVRDRLERRIEGYAFPVSPWQSERRNQLDAIDYEKKMMAFILMFIILVAGINMFTTLWMLVTEKTRDVGILSALGVSRFGVLQLFLTMGVFITLLGEVLGFIGGMLIVENIAAIENFLWETFGFKMFDPTVYIFDHLPAEPEPSTIAVILVTTFCASIVFSAAPAIRAAAKHPVQALRYE